jgi:hypothetical protein
MVQDDYDLMYMGTTILVTRQAKQKLMENGLVRFLWIGCLLLRSIENPGIITRTGVKLDRTSAL